MHIEHVSTAMHKILFYKKLYILDTLNKKEHTQLALYALFFTERVGFAPLLPRDGSYIFLGSCWAEICFLPKGFIVSRYHAAAGKMLPKVAFFSSAGSNPLNKNST